MSRDRRKHTRARKRLRIRFGDAELEFSGFTADVSVGGLFLVADRLFAPNSRIHLHVIGARSDFYAEGRIVRVKTVPLNLRVLERPGMGIRFLSSAEVVALLIPPGQRKKETIALVCSTPESLHKMLHDQLAHGLVVLTLAEPPPEPNTVVEFCIRAAFAGGKAVEARGRVMQILPNEGEGEDARAVVEVENAMGLREKLHEILIAES